jgi:hypothetical protein
MSDDFVRPPRRNGIQPSLVLAGLFWSDRWSASYEIHYEDDYCDHEQQMDQATAHMSQQTQQPQNKKNYEYGPKH